MRVQSLHWRVCCLVIVFAFQLLLTGCGKGDSDSDSSKIRLQLNWFPDAQHGGFYTALQNGYYEEEGLDVEILVGGPGANVEAKVDLGRVEFGVANAHKILLKRNFGAKITAVFAAFQNSPRCIMVHEESGIENFEDLEGKKLAVGSDRAFYEFMKQKVGLNDVSDVPYSGSNARFLQDKNYCQQAYSFSEPILVKRKGANPKALMISDLGFNPYTSCLFVSEKYLEENPELVKKFVRATQKGWQDYLEDPEKTNREMEKLNKEHDLEALNDGAVAAKPLCQPNPEVVVGSMEAGRWETLVKQLKSLDMLESDFEVSGAFSLDYLPESP